ncbi:IS1096 element passenger TnpR family protein [Enterobacter kobei]|uniref:IS1096 element passenger TnpR family protein n=1 Tax=Enterobacter kobei TaxID=208224 RepID=UPI00388F7DCA
MIDDFAFDAGDRFTYEYNFFEHWLHDIRVEAICEKLYAESAVLYKRHGMPGATAADEFDKTLAFLEAIVNADDETTVGEIRPFADDLDAVPVQPPQNQPATEQARPCISGTGA